jgi:hypothetical protein
MSELWRVYGDSNGFGMLEAFVDCESEAGDEAVAFIHELISIVSPLAVMGVSITIRLLDPEGNTVGDWLLQDGAVLGTL